MRYHLKFVKYRVSLGEFKSKTSLKKNYKCQLEPINPSVKFKGLVWNVGNLGLLHSLSLDLIWCILSISKTL